MSDSESESLSGRLVCGSGTVGSSVVIGGAVKTTVLSPKSSSDGKGTPESSPPVIEHHAELLGGGHPSL